MDSWNAEPLNGVNGIKFGMKRELIRDKFDRKFKEFRKTKYSKITTDDFGFFHIYYNEKDECEAIEIFDGIEIYMCGIKIFPESITKIKKVILDLEEDSGSYISKKMSIGIYAPCDKIESILFGKCAYYE